MDHEPSDKIPVISYFTGGGFLDLGFLAHDFQTVWRNENTSAFIEGFEHGMSTLFGPKGGHRIENKNSILTITPKQVAREAFHNTGKPETFGVIGGPPCSDFANGGKHKGGEGKNGMLTEVFVDHILELQPSFFLFENVKGLFQNEKHRSFLDELIGKLGTHYSTSMRVLDALQYGVPQSRERVFLAGLRKNWLRKTMGISRSLNGDGSWFPWPRKKHRDPKNSYAWPSQEPFGSKPRRPTGIPAELMVGTWICDPNVDLTKLPNGMDQFVARSDKFSRINEGDDTRKSFKRLHRWRYSPTAAYGKNEVHLHPIQERRLSVREVMRIQTVPDKYILPAEMSLTDKFRLVSNGVPVLLAKAVAGSFQKILTERWLIAGEKP